MQFNHDLDVHNHVIRSYDQGQITIVLPYDENTPSNPNDEQDANNRGLQQEVLRQSLVLMPHLLQRDWPPQTVSELSTADVSALAALTPEIVIIGTGARLQWPVTEVLKPLIDAGIGYEIMDTRAACRTYNILSNEGRDVAAALMMI